ncbi:MAG: CRISPR-associated helicase Cas3' [Oscillospiraceae bacterium]|nr:CRISPR-associated helicase Cas3' [Oscillospiraceae bacterium]
MEFYAHTRQDGTGEEVRQTVAEHCRGAARYARECLDGVGLGEAGYFAGLVHDMGKMKQEFADYLLSGQGVRGSVNHSFAGCRMVLEQFHGENAAACSDLTAELLAYAIGGHHGLFDCVDENGNSGFLHRMEKQNIGYAESRKNFLDHCASEKELAEWFQKADAELTGVYEKLGPLAGEDPTESAFHLGLLARLLLSAVIEGDRRDTAEFMNGVRYPSGPADRPHFWTEYLVRVEERLAGFSRKTAIGRARGMISDRCRVFAEKESGVYRLNVPTGAGKTLSSLRFALAHASRWGKRRIIFTAPLLAILEQNAAVIRDWLGDDSIVLEHHSNVLQTEEGDGLDLRELAVESWNAPVIITTLVQLLNTLFDGRTTSIRRFQSLCSSIIVIDEVQTVPTRMLTLFNLAVDFLSEVCGATVLLCSATQPCLEQAAHPLRTCRGDVIPYDEALWAPFRRTEILDAGNKNLEEIAEFAREAIDEVQSLLVVCNKKDEAEYLYRALSDAADLCCHLSAAMCTAHRRDTLAKLNAALTAGRKCLCVATQVIEAGVDISFQRVIRLSAGMDNIIQAAGRCNRHGEQEQAVPVYIVSFLGENLSRLTDIRQAKDATTSLLEAYRRDPGRFQKDLSSDDAIRFYYQKLYRAMPGGFQDCTVKEKRVTLYDLLSFNAKYWDDSSPFYGKYMLNQAFRLAGSLFTVFDSNTQDVVVPYGEGANLIAELAGQNAPDQAFLADWLRRAKPYTAALYDYQVRALAEALTEYGGVMVLNSEFYEDAVGLTLKPGQLDYLEV